MKIDLVSPFFFPEPISSGKYNTYLAETLARRGHEVRVTCFEPFYPDWVVRPTTKMLPGIAIHRGKPGMKFPTSLILRRALLELSFCLHAMNAKSRGDIFIAVLPPSLFALCVSKVFYTSSRSRKIAIIHDLQGVYLKRATGFSSKIVSKAVKWVEKTSLRSFDKVIFLSNEMKEQCKRDYGISEEKCAVHYPFCTIETSQTEDRALADLMSPDRLHVTYSGALGEKQNPLGLLGLMSNIVQKFPGVEAHIFSSGPEFEKLKGLAANSPIKFHDLVSESQLLSLYVKSALHIIPQAPMTSSGSMPSKFPNAVYSGSPILVITDPDSELEQICKGLPSVVVATTWDSSAILPLIAKHLDSNAPKFREVNNHFSIDPLISEILQGI